MAWDVEHTEEFEAWWRGLDEGEQNSVAAIVGLLESLGPTLDYPYSSAVHGSKHAMRELRIQHGGEPYRVLYVFDPRRSAVLLVGGCKTGNDRWYDEMIPKADDIFDAVLIQLKREGLIP